MNQTMLPAGLKERVLNGARRDPAPTRRATRTDTGLLTLIAVAGAVNVFFVFGGMKIETHAAPMAYPTAAGWLLLAGATTWASLSRGGSMLGRSLPWLWSVTSITPLATVAWLFCASNHAGATAFPSDVHCVSLATLLGLWPLGAMTFVHRHRFVVHPRATGIALGAASGVWPQVFMSVHCPALPLGHAALSHVGPMVFFMFLGAWLGKAPLRQDLRAETSSVAREI